MIAKKSSITVSITGILILGMCLVGVLSIIPSESYACGGYGPPPPPPPPVPPSPKPEPTSNPDNQDPNKQDPCEPNDPPIDGNTLGDPVSLKSGAFDYSCKDLVIKGRSLDVVIERSYSSNAYNGKPAVFDFSFGLYMTGTGGTCVTDINWTLPGVAYDIKQWDSNHPGCALPVFRIPPYYLGTHVEFKVPPGSYQVGLYVKDIYWWYGQPTEFGDTLGGVGNRENTYHYHIYGSEYSSRFGHGWDMNYNMKLCDFGNPNTIAFFDGHNRRFTYHLKSGTNPAEYTPPAGRYDKLVKNANGTYTMTEKDGKKYEFDTYGLLSAIKDRVGNRLTFKQKGYGCNKKLTKITDDLGREIGLGYNSRGLLSVIVDFDGRTWTYTYDPCNNNLLSVTGPTNLATSYGYGHNHRLETITDPNGQTWLRNYYDGSQVGIQENGYNYSFFDFSTYANETTYTDRRGNVSKTIYNQYGHVLKEIAYTDGLRETDPNCYTTSYSYDANMGLTKKIFPAGNYNYYRYDPNGNRLLIAREPNNGEPNIVTRYTYEPKYNRVRTVTDPKGNIITLDYDDLTGSLTKITFPQVATPAGPRNPQVGFNYNSFGQVETILLPDGILIKGEYGNDKLNDPNNYGRLTKVIYDANEADPCSLKIATVYEYDIRGNLIEVNDPCGNVTKFAYNLIDKVTKITDPFDNSTNFFYNNNKKVSRIERERTGDDQIIKLSYDILDNIKAITDPCNYVTKLGYDYEENLSDVNDAEENNTHYQYDERNLLWKSVDANGGVTEYSYTPNRKLREIKDAKGSVTGYHYDGLNRFLWIQYPDDTNEAFTYDKNSDVTSKRSRKGQTIYYEYDALDQMTVKHRPGEPNITFLYDITGRVVQANDGRSVAQGGGLTTYAYDRIGRVVEVNDIYGHLVKYSYDKLGRRTKLTYPDGSFVNYEYDALSRLTKVKYNGNTIAEYGYDELSRRTLLTYGSNANIVYNYDIANKLTRITSNMDSCSIDIEYGNYDKVGNRKSMKVNDANAQAYTYDKLYQLIFVDYNNSSTTNYYYDPLGNRTKETNGKNVTYTSNSLNQYTSAIGYAGSVVGYWKMDDDANSYEVIDNSGNGHHAAAQRNTSILHTDSGEPPNLNGALIFNGSSDYITTPLTDLPAGASTRSASLWIKWNGSATYNVIFGYGDNAAGSKMFGAFLDPGGNLFCWNNYQSNSENYDTGIDITAGTWTHIALTYDGTNIRTYKNGVLVDTRAKALDTVLEKSVIGRNNWASAHCFAGSMDDVMIFNRALTAEEIRTLYYSAKLSYDVAGNMTSDRNGLAYKYDCENRLTDVNDANGNPLASYKYDYRSRRVAKMLGASQTTINYIYDGSQVIADYNNAGVLQRKFIYGPGIDEPIMMININGSETRYYYHYDGLGSVVALSDSSGNLVESYSYDVFGYPNTVSSIGNRFMFTGREFDNETGLYYYRTRYYKPSIGRFLQTDLIKYRGGLNLYTYCGNNPLNWLDPWGLKSYRARRGLGIFGDTSARWSRDPGGHDMRLTADNGKVKDTYSWGAEDNKWNKNNEVDQKAAQEALDKGWADEVGDDSMDDFYDKAYDIKKDEPAHDWKLNDNCQNEGQDLDKLATAHFITSKIAVFDTDNAALGGYEMASKKLQEEAEKGEEKEKKGSES